MTIFANCHIGKNWHTGGMPVFNHYLVFVVYDSFWQCVKVITLFNTLSSLTVKTSYNPVLYHYHRHITEQIHGKVPHFPLPNTHTNGNKMEIINTGCSCQPSFTYLMASNMLEHDQHQLIQMLIPIYCAPLQFSSNSFVLVDMSFTGVFTFSDLKI